MIGCVSPVFSSAFNVHIFVSYTSRLILWLEMLNPHELPVLVRKMPEVYI